MTGREARAVFPDWPGMITFSLINSKWKLAILWALTDRKMRFGELRRSMGTISQKVLTEQLRDLEGDGLVNRITYPEVPPRVEYELTELGQSLRPVLDSLWEWGRNYRELRPEELGRNTNHIA